MPKFTADQELATYGRVLTGSETDLEKAKIARGFYLKKKMRRKLETDIGDGPDNISDLQRAIILGDAINAGIVADSQIATRYHLYIQDLLQDYGGADAIMDVLEYDKTALEQHVVAGYFLAKQTIDEAEDEDDVRGVDLPGEPVTNPYTSVVEPEVKQAAMPQVEDEDML